jgi:hypothetical protein
MQTVTKSVDFESVLVCRNENGSIVAIYVNDIPKRKISLYTVNELGLEDIKDFMESLVEKETLMINENNI